MGWKTLKETFAIEHTVTVTDKGICIGSGYVHDLVTIDPETGKLSENSAFSSFLPREYPALAAASPEYLLRLIKEKDTFTKSIPVYTYEGDRIIEEHCEEPGWPNVTHLGHLMYENTYSTDKEQVVAWAKRNARGHSMYAQEEIERLEEQINTRRSQLVKAQAWQATLDADYPTIPAEL